MLGRAAAWRGEEEGWRGKGNLQEDRIKDNDRNSDISVKTDGYV